MSDLVNALLITLFLVLPGIAGNIVYEKVAGRNWKQEPWRTLVRIFGISLGGLIVYILIGSLLNAPLPTYLSNETLDTFASRRGASIRLSIAFLGHFIGAALVAFLAAKASQALRKGARRSDFADRWHEFVSVHANGQRVVIGTRGGAAYAGYIQPADPGIDTDQRDVILAEPSVYRIEQDSYSPLPYRSLFLPAETVESIAIASNQPKSRPAAPKTASTATQPSDV